MFDPIDFFEFAEELKPQTFQHVEACQRTIISRMYYAVFLIIREIVKDKLKDTPVESMYASLYRSPYIHRVVLDVTNIANTHTRNLLHSLRVKRDDADYRLHLPNLVGKLNKVSATTKELFDKRLPVLPSNIDQHLIQIQDKVEEWQTKESKRLRR